MEYQANTKKRGSESSRSRSAALAASNQEEILSCRKDRERNTKISTHRRTNRTPILTSSRQRLGTAAAGKLCGTAEGGPGRAVDRGRELAVCGRSSRRESQPFNLRI